MSRTIQGRDPQGLPSKRACKQSKPRNAQEEYGQEKMPRTPFGKVRSVEVCRKEEDAQMQSTKTGRSRRSSGSVKISNHKRKWDQTKGESFWKTNTGASCKLNSLGRTIKKSKQEVVATHELRNQHPPIDQGIVWTMGSIGHNCPINVLLASLLGKV